MKRILFILLLAVATVGTALPANAEKEEYLEFMGIPIEGGVSSFVRKMQSKGFKIDTYVDNNNVVLTGTFAGYQYCTVYVCGDDSKQMSHVYVTFPVQNNWTELEQRYHTLKNNLQEKYGTPVSIEECIDENVTDKMAQLSNGECNYRAEFVVYDDADTENIKYRFNAFYDTYFPNGHLDTAKVKSKLNDFVEKSTGMPVEKLEKLETQEKCKEMEKIVSSLFGEMMGFFTGDRQEELGTIVLTLMNSDTFGNGKVTLLYQDRKQKERIHKENLKDL